MLGARAEPRSSPDRWLPRKERERSGTVSRRSRSQPEFVQRAGVAGRIREVKSAGLSKCTSDAYQRLKFPVVWPRSVSFLVAYFGERHQNLPGPTIHVILGDDAPHAGHSA